jgi:hypothetical protein
MKYLISILLLAVCPALFAATPDVNVSVQTNAALIQTSFSTPFATTSTSWSAKNLGYGPIELVSGALAPFGGMLIGGFIGAMIPIETMEKNQYLVVPYSTLAGAATGTTMGAMISPIIILEGLFDTLTGGVFADRPFSWFKFGDKESEESGPAIIESDE